MITISSLTRFQFPEASSPPPPQTPSFTPQTPTSCTPPEPLDAMAQDMALSVACAVPSSKADEADMDVDEETGGTDLSSVPALGAGGLLSSSAGATITSDISAFAFVLPTGAKAGTGLPPAPRAGTGLSSMLSTSSVETERGMLAHQNVQLRLQVEDLQAKFVTACSTAQELLDSAHASAETARVEAKRSQLEAETEKKR